MTTIYGLYLSHHYTLYCLHNHTCSYAFVSLEVLVHSLLSPHTHTHMHCYCIVNCKMQEFRPPDATHVKKLFLYRNKILKFKKSKKVLAWIMNWSKINAITFVMKSDVTRTRKCQLLFAGLHWTKSVLKCRGRMVMKSRYQGGSWY